MHRYLLNISYIGTKFRGIQRNVEHKELRSTIQGSIELGLKLLQPVNEPTLILSSRTDVGVHALHSSVQVDLERKNGKPYPVSSITQRLNKFFCKEDLQIQVSKTELVPDTFNCRYLAKERTYLYRLGVAKREPLWNKKFLANIPIEEIDRCYFVQNPNFDIDRARQAAELFKGKHDFRTFMNKSRSIQQNNPFFSIRTINSIRIEPGQPSCTSYSIQKSPNDYNYWDIQISGRSFLYRQVRRIVGIILAVAQNRLTNRDVYEMLTIPSTYSWCPRATVVPPHGLYLCKVDYDENEKKFPIDLTTESTTNEDELINNEFPERTEN